MKFDKAVGRLKGALDIVLTYELLCTVLYNLVSWVIGDVVL